MLAPKRGWPLDDVGLGRGEVMNSAVEQDKQFGVSGELHQILKLRIHSDGLPPLRQPSGENEDGLRSRPPHRRRFLSCGYSETTTGKKPGCGAKWTLGTNPVDR